jgi:hypothetical protein
MEFAIASLNPYRAADRRGQGELPRAPRCWGPLNKCINRNLVFSAVKVFFENFKPVFRLTDDRASPMHEKTGTVGFQVLRLEVAFQLYIRNRKALSPKFKVVDIFTVDRFKNNCFKIIEKLYTF